MEETLYGSFIRQRRKELSISQQELADVLGCTPQAISKYENNISPIYLEILGPLAKALQVDITSFLLQKSEKNNDLADKLDFDRNHFLDTLTFLREQRLLTQKALSEKTEIPSFKITKWETHKALPTVSEFMHLTEFYHLTYEELYFGLTQKHPEQEEEKIVSSEKKAKNYRKLILPIGIALLVLILVLVLVLVFLPSSTDVSSSLPASPLPSSSPASSPDSTITSPPIGLETVVITN